MRSETNQTEPTEKRRMTVGLIVKLAKLSHSVIFFLALSLFPALASAAGPTVVVINEGGGSNLDGSDGLEITLDINSPQMQIKSQGANWFSENNWRGGGRIDSGAYVSAPSLQPLAAPNAGTSAAVYGPSFQAQAFAGANTSEVTGTTLPSGKKQFSVTQTFKTKENLTLSINWVYSPPDQYITANVTLNIPDDYQVYNSSNGNTGTISGSYPVRYFHGQNVVNLSGGCMVRYSSRPVMIGAFTGSPSCNDKTLAGVPTNATKAVILKGLSDSFARQSGYEYFFADLPSIQRNESFDNGTFYEVQGDAASMVIAASFTKPGVQSFSYLIGYQPPQTLDHIELRHTGKASVLCGSADATVVACQTSEVPCKDWNIYTDKAITNVSVDSYGGEVNEGYGAVAFTPSSFTIPKGGVIPLTVKARQAAEKSVLRFNTTKDSWNSSYNTLPYPKNPNRCLNTETGKEDCTMVVDGGPCMGFECMASVSGQSYVNPKEVSGARNPLLTQLVGETFSVDVVALNLDGSVKEDYVTPDTGTDTVLLFSDTRLPNKVCPTTAAAAIQAPKPLPLLKFTAADKGRKTVSGIAINQTYGKVSCQVLSADEALKDASNQTLPAQTFCSSDSFTVRPKELTKVSAAGERGLLNLDPKGFLASNETAADPYAVSRAGRPFTLSVEAGFGYTGRPEVDPKMIQWNDASGTPPSGRPSKYGRADPGVGTLNGVNKKVNASGTAIEPPVSGNMVFQQAGTVGYSYGSSVLTTWPASGQFTYDEVGYFQFLSHGVYDASYVNLSNDKANKDCIEGSFSNKRDGSGRYGCSFGNTEPTDHFGRFTVNHFATDVVQGCSTNADPKKQFTYHRQPFQLIVRALNFAGQPTQNFADKFAVGWDGAAVSLQAVANLNATHNAGDYRGAIFPSKMKPESFKQGVATTGKDRDGNETEFAIFSFNLYWHAQDEAATAPSYMDARSPFTDVIRAELPQGWSSGGGQQTMLTSNLWDGDEKNQQINQVEGAVTIRKGRTRIIPFAFGSQAADLKLLFVTEYMKGGNWITSDDDNCTGNTALEVAGKPPSFATNGYQGQAHTIASNSNAVSVKITPVSAPNITTHVLDTGTPGLSGAQGVFETNEAKRFKRATSPNGSFAGDFNLWLKAPNARGTVKVMANVPDWLPLWPKISCNSNSVCTADFSKEPESIVSFGKNQSKWIYRREVY